MKQAFPRAGIYTSVLFLLCSFTSEKFAGQSVVSTDVHNFWVAYDSIHRINDTMRQEKIIEEIYFAKGTPGLKEFIRIRNWTSRKFRQRIAAYPAFWNSVRPFTVNISKDSLGIEHLLNRYKTLYGNFKEPTIYFTISPIGTGGTTTQDKVLIGAEISAGDSRVDADGLNPFLKAFFKTNQGITSLVAHELTHTQQKGGDMEDRRNTNLLGLCLAEGMCDFMAELLLGKPLERPYIGYGFAHQEALWNLFEVQMEEKDSGNWLYNGGDKKNGDADLGYFIGYAICRSLYLHSGNKTKAVSQILSLNLEDKAALNSFLKRSKYDGHLKANIKI